jgi:murein DD-endopeptidase MepM/ murein hydrolase activator NlpD
MMVWPLPGNVKITAGFHDQRPVLNPGEHVHGAIDISTKNGSPIIAPERGKLIMYFARRPKDGVYWPSGEMNHFPYRNYFYDMYGGLLVLKGDSGFTHVFTHIYMNQMHNKEQHDWAYIEEKANERFPIFCMIAGEIEVLKGAKIGVTGNSGFSTGSHCHYEMHKGFKYQKHIDRPNPQEIIWEDFE